MAILKLHHAQLTVPSDRVSEALTFYRDFLGLVQVEKPDSLKARGGIWLQLGAQQIHLSGEDGVERTRTKAHLAYEVGDLEEWRRKLRARGIETLDGVPIPGFARFEFRDPFGHRVEFLQRLT